MRSPSLLFRSIAPLLVLVLILSSRTVVFSEDDINSLSFQEACQRDLSHWQDLLENGKFDDLEKIADELRTSNAKYRNGRGRLWRFAWCTLLDNHRDRSESDYAKSFAQLENWLKAYPQSVNARLVLAHTWQKYSLRARGGNPTTETPASPIESFEARNDKASSYLDEIDGLTKSYDNVYRRLRIELSKDKGIKPDVQLVYDGLKDDPTSMELVHGMSICLLPRWYGEEGELERFADAVVERTKEKCGELHYVTAAVATKELLKSYLLDTHHFDMGRLRQGFRDLERLYPNSREHLDDEAQLAFMAEDLETVYATMEKIGEHPALESWKQTEVFWNELKPRFTREMMQGEQKRLLLGHARPVLALEIVQGGKTAVSCDPDYGIRLHEVSTGKRLHWIYLRGIQADSMSVDPKTGILASGMNEEPGVALLSLINGQVGTLPDPQGKVTRTEVSPQGAQLVTANEDGVVSAFDLKTGKVMHESKPVNKRQVNDMAFSSNSTELALAENSGGVQIFALKKNWESREYQVGATPLTSIAWNGKYIAVGSRQGDVFVLNSKTGETIATWKSDPLEIATLAFSPNGKKLAMGLRAESRDAIVNNPLQIWDFEADKSPKPLLGHKMGVNRVRFVDSGKTLLSGSNDWTIRVWDVP